MDVPDIKWFIDNQLKIYLKLNKYEKRMQELYTYVRICMKLHIYISRVLFFLKLHSN